MKKYLVMWKDGDTTKGKHIEAENEEEAVEKANIPMRCYSWANEVVIDNSNRCVYCGYIIPEGTQICRKCEQKNG